MIATRPLRCVLFCGALYLFIFLSINREAALFDFDPRYALVGMMVIAFMFSLHDAPRKRNARIAGEEKLLIVYYALILLSSFSLVKTTLPIDYGMLGNVAILHFVNAFMFVLIILNKEAIKPSSVSKAICIAGIVLGISQILVYCGVDIGAFLQSADTRTMAVDRGAGEHINLFGQHFRVSGFAEDPNYACFFNVLCAAVALHVRRSHKMLAAVTVAMSALGIAFSWSRTVVFGSIAVAVFVAFAYSVPKIRKNILAIFPCIVALMALLLPILKLTSLQTMDTRYTLWTNAYHLFLESPVIGSGLTSFRSYNSLMQLGWYVHPHSSYWETMSEFGIIAFVVLVAIFVLAMQRTKTPFASFLVAAFALFSVNFDCTYLQMSIVVLVLVPAFAEIETAKDDREPAARAGRLVFVASTARLTRSLHREAMYPCKPKAEL